MPIEITQVEWTIYVRSAQIPIMKTQKNQYAQTLASFNKLSFQKKKKKAQLNVTNQRWNPALFFFLQHCFFFLQLSCIAIHKENQLLNLQATAHPVQVQWQALLDSLDLHLKKVRLLPCWTCILSSHFFCDRYSHFLFQNKDVAQIEAPLSDLSMRHSPGEKSYEPVLQAHNI